MASCGFATGASPGASSTVSAKEWITLMELEGYRRLAREMHLRACPNCGSPVDIGFGIDGYTQCTECMARFRWLHAALFLPVSSVGGLLQEVQAQLWQTHTPPFPKELCPSAMTLLLPCFHHS